MVVAVIAEMKMVTRSRSMAIPNAVCLRLSRSGTTYVGIEALAGLVHRDMAERSFVVWGASLWRGNLGPSSFVHQLSVIVFASSRNVRKHAATLCTRELHAVSYASNLRKWNSYRVQDHVECIQGVVMLARREQL